MRKKGRSWKERITDDIMQYRTDGADAQENDDHNIINDGFDLTPPEWFERQHQAPPVNVDDDFESKWLDALSDDGSAPAYYSTEPVELAEFGAGGDGPLIGVLWQGRQWACTVRGVARRDGSFFVSFAEIWNADVIRHAVATEQCDFDDLKEALRIGRRIDCYFDPVRGM